MKSSVLRNFITIKSADLFFSVNSGFLSYIITEKTIIFLKKNLFFISKWEKISRTTQGTNAMWISCVHDKLWTETLWLFGQDQETYVLALRRKWFTFSCTDLAISESYRHKLRSQIQLMLEWRNEHTWKVMTFYYLMFIFNHKLVL